MRKNINKFKILLNKKGSEILTYLITIAVLGGLTVSSISIISKSFQDKQDEVRNSLDDMNSSLTDTSARSYTDNEVNDNTNTDATINNNSDTNTNNTNSNQPQKKEMLYKDINGSND